jgi:hypothetical protein
MPIERTIAPSAALGRGGTAVSSRAASVFGPLGEDAEISLFAEGNRGELPGEYSRRPQFLEETESESPYWATWGF